MKMDYRVDWSPEALEDVESIAEYISRDSEFYAKAVVTAIIHLSRGVNEFPFIGRVVLFCFRRKWNFSN